MRVPVVFTPTDIINWTVSEEYRPGKWRPSRWSAFYGWKHFTFRVKTAWMVFTGKFDALSWGKTSGEISCDKIRYKDCTDPEFFNAAKIVEYNPSRVD